MDDRPTFDRVYLWAVAHLNEGVRKDHLWAWKWGKGKDGAPRVLDKAFASDADQDAALALLLAGRTWGDVAYSQRARSVIADLFDQGTVVVKGRRYLLGGDFLCSGPRCRLNPSYYAPYAYRAFGREDPSRAWGDLVETSYSLLERNSALTETHLPSDWLLLDTVSGDLRPGTERDSQYSYDAFRVHWRIALDSVLNSDPRAHAYLKSSLAWLVSEWKTKGKLPAAISARGRPRVEYGSLEMIAALTGALSEVDTEVAAQMEERVKKALSDGYWGEKDSYYIQNWAWFGTALYSRSLGPLTLLRSPQGPQNPE
jgi:endoglucanase